ncbi:MAG TPA: RNA polymerase sigma factor [Woeseiaceae bacterium]|nr:RNA polymerase sigma factor [Woeseiaceae bacterium]
MAAVRKDNALPTRGEFHAAISNRADRWFAACLKITRSRELAEDAVQDALLTAWDKRAQFERGSRLDTWIHRIAINSALQLLRKHRPARFDSLDFEPIDDSASLIDVRYADELGDELATALACLSDIERICFVLKHLEQWRLKEIAVELDTTVGTTKQALFRAVRKLRVAMPELGPGNTSDETAVAAGLR